MYSYPMTQAYGNILELVVWSATRNSAFSPQLMKHADLHRPYPSVSDHLELFIAHDSGHRGDG